jgi:hypothetical protein
MEGISCSLEAAKFKTWVACKLRTKGGGQRLNSDAVACSAGQVCRALVASRRNQLKFMITKKKNDALRRMVQNHSSYSSDMCTVSLKKDAAALR